ncbi:hypothetical protein EV144_106233 [Flavobacterium sp. 270]|uniref:hypothetical protein n=1 Tax=Flavobacterium sp. 270 TaxID=2512114 RepID=UPI001064D094|nr:hypothetical protein [Flavobacterium sp. 270]TDW46561.1 hypothetical protein EV144_106233 [Flavobacterium sp. 270]
MNPKEQLTEKLKNWLEETNVISYDKDIGFRCRDKELRELRDGKTEKEVYIISFNTEDNITYDKNGEIISLFEGMLCFAYFDAETLELLYISKKAGYIEVDGSY